MAKYFRYFKAEVDLPVISYEWPLYGAGLDNLGKNGKPIERSMPTYGDDELLIRHDAVGLCFTDVKEITYGDQHPRLIERGLATNPIVPGHEASITVLRVGKNLKHQYSPGDRFVIQPDVWYQGKSIPYSFGMDGAYRQYGIAGKEILQGDEGNYLIPIPENMSYAGAALTEPWACVEASYSMKYRTALCDNGCMWIVGNKHSRSGYTLKKIWNDANKPSQVILTNVPSDFEKKIISLCRQNGIKTENKEKEGVYRSDLKFNDIVLLDGEVDDINNAGALLQNDGILSILRKDSLKEKIKIDIGRIHYDNLVYVGTTGINIDDAYMKTPVRCELKKGGSAFVLGGGGPMGRMHVQRAIESSCRPSRLMVTDVDDNRIEDLKESFSALSSSMKIDFIVMSSIKDKELYNTTMEKMTKDGGFDDIAVMVTNLNAIEENCQYVGDSGVINFFGGLKRGTMAEVDPWLIYGPRQVRFIGHSGSKLGDQVTIVDRFKNGELEPHRSMAALCGMNQIPRGVNAMMESVYPGKIVVYPMVRDFPLTGLKELKHILPEVYRKLENGRFWTVEAEKSFLESQLL